jgi:hypothetical protein
MKPFRYSAGDDSLFLFAALLNATGALQPTVFTGPEGRPLPNIQPATPASPPISQ